MLGRRWGALVLIALVVVSMLNVARIYYDPAYEKEDWRGVAQYVEQHEQPGDLVMPLLYQSLTPLLGQYYHGQSPVEPVLVGAQARDPEVLTANYERVWFIVPHHHNSTHLLARCEPTDPLDPAIYAERVVRAWLENHRSDLVRSQDFACISVLLFDLDAMGGGR